MTAAQESHQKLLGHAGLLSMMTMTSRFLGMVRDMVCASIFGTGMVWDAFIYAFTIPNFLRRALGEGTLSACFIPVYSEVRKKEGEAAAEQLANNLFTLLFVGVSLLSILVVAAVFLLRQAVAWPEIGMLTLKLLMILFPYILFLSMYAIAMAILNTQHRFLIPALGPIILNAVWIGAVLWIAPRVTDTKADQVTVLAWCLLGAGLLQFLVQLIPLRQSGFRWRWVWSFTAPAVRKIFKLFLPATFGFAAMQVDVLIDRTFAVFIGAGAASSLWYGTRLVQLPMGLFAIAMSTALLPKLSEHATESNLKDFAETLSFSLKAVLVMVVPAGIGFVALGVPIVNVLFERGAFDAASTARTAATLQAYAIGLFAYSGTSLVVSAFYALKDTRTPVVVSTLCIVLNSVLDLALMGPFREMGLALSTAIAGILNFGILIYILQRKHCRLGGRAVITTFLKSLVASFIMGGVALFLFYALGGTGGSTPAKAFHLIAAITTGIAVYFGLCFLFRVSEARYVLALFFRRSHDTSRASS